MSRRVWNTRTPRDPLFEAAWRARLARAGHAHFTFDLAYLDHEARLGRSAMAMLVDDPGLAAAMVVRDGAAAAESGWPWRWEAVVEEGGDALAPGLTAQEAERLCHHAGVSTAGRRIRLFLPHPVRSLASYRAGATFVHDLSAGEDGLWKAMEDAKRRMVKKAKNRGYEIVEANDPAAFREFATIQRTTRVRQGYRDEPEESEAPPPGEAWREWELPWMWLLVAVKEGRVEAGSGFGVFPGGSVDYRTNASTDAARKDGANVLLGWEALRLASERGFRWLNWCGTTRFKREFGGDRVEVFCRLGGGPLWVFPNIASATLQRTRARLGGWRRAVRGRMADASAGWTKRKRTERGTAKPRGQTRSGTG